MNRCGIIDHSGWQSQLTLQRLLALRNPEYFRGFLKKDRGVSGETVWVQWMRMYCRAYKSLLSPLCIQRFFSAGLFILNSAQIKDKPNYMDRTKNHPEEFQPDLT